MLNGEFAEKDSVLFGSRWLVLLFICGALVAFRVQIGVFNSEGLLTAFIIGALLNGLVFICLALPGLRPAVSPVLLVSDVIVAGLFAGLSEGNFFVVIVAGSALMIAGLLRPMV